MAREGFNRAHTFYTDHIYLDRAYKDVHLYRKGADELGSDDDINIGLRRLRTTSHLLREIDTASLGLRSSYDVDDRKFKAREFHASANIYYTGSVGYFQAMYSDGAYVMFRARRSGAGMVEVARLLGAAEPRFKFTQPATLYRDAGDYGGNFSLYNPPTGTEGDIIIAEDTNATAPGRRIYVYSGGAWRYVNLT